MDKHTCATFYELELEKTSYKHPYHKFDIVRNENYVKNEKRPNNYSFKFQSFPKNNLELTFKTRSPTYSPVINKRPTSSLSKNSVSPNHKSWNLKILTSSLQFNSKIFQSLKIKGSSALLRQRTINTSYQLSKHYTFNKINDEAIRVKVRIKNIGKNKLSK